MSVYFSPILRILEDHGMLIPSQSPKFGSYAHMFVLPLSLHKYVYCRAASTHFIIWVFYISTVDSNWPRSSKYENDFRHVPVPALLAPSLINGRVHYINCWFKY